MKVELNNLGKRFTHEWIFRNLSYQFSAGSKYAILGPNGSGKSTLMQLLSGSVTPTEGAIVYQVDGSSVPVEDIYALVGYCAPYIQLIEEFTLLEVLSFHHNFRPFKDLSIADVLSLLELEKHQNKQVSAFSSGMKQRVKLGLAMLSGASLILLDEPATNLDALGIAWYKSILSAHCSNAIVIISSNRLDEYDVCDEDLSITNFK